MNDKRAKSDAGTRRLVLDTAARLFRDQGYAAVTLRTVAAEVGVKPASLYYHFANKDDLVAEVLDAGIQLVLDAVREAVAAVPPDAGHEARLRAAVQGHLHSLLAHSDYTSANVRIFGQLPPEVQARNLPLRTAYEDLWGRLLREAEAAGCLRPGVDLRLFRRLLLGALNASVEWFRPDIGPIEELANQTADLLLHGILTPETA